MRLVLPDNLPKEYCFYNKWVFFCHILSANKYARHNKMLLLSKPMLIDGNPEMKRSRKEFEIMFKLLQLFQCKS